MQTHHILPPGQHIQWTIARAPGAYIRIGLVSVSPGSPVTVYLVDDFNYTRLLTGDEFAANLVYRSIHVLPASVIKLPRGGAWHLVIANEGVSPADLRVEFQPI